MTSSSSSGRKRRRESPESDHRSKYSKYDRDGRREDYDRKHSSSSSSRRDKYHDDEHYSRSSRDRDEDYYRHSRRHREDRERDERRHRDHRDEREDSHRRRDEKERHRSREKSSERRHRHSSREKTSEREIRKKEEAKQQEIQKNNEDIQKQEAEALKAQQEAEQEKIREAEKKLDDEEVQKRKERISKWRELRKLKEKEEEQSAAAALQATDNRKQWSLDDDDEDDETMQTDSSENKPIAPIIEPPPSIKLPELTKEIAAPVNEEDDDIDPLEAFMQNLAEMPVETSSSDQPKVNKQKRNTKNDQYFDDIDDEEEKEEDEGEEWKQKVSRKRELQTVDHATMNYIPFNKNFYIEVPEIAKMTPEEVVEYRESLDNIQIRGKKAPKPIKGFHQCGLNDKILETLRKHNYEKPTPIQAQAIPTIMSGRDLIGIAKTGSGKTLAFLLPLFRHVLDQPLPAPGEGPISIIMAPTRELVVQIHAELRRFGKRLGIKSVCIFGGADISHQIGDLKRGAAVAVCTPGRMIDILCTNAGRVTNLKRVTYLVLDEADRMFDMGFEPQIMRIIDNIRPDRQTVLFSATFPRQVENVARKILKRPVEIVVGGVSVVCSDVNQIVEVRPEETKFTRLLQLLGEWISKGSILVFVNQQEDCDNIFRRLIHAGYQCCSLHGGKDQMDRASTLTDFKSQAIPVLIATSVAARGLDVPSLCLVINYQSPNHYEDYVHRCGRTGRAGRKGTAITFISPEEEQFAPDLARALTNAKLDVPAELQKLVDSYTKNLTKGEATQHGSGFGGSGYKFDEAEDQAKKNQEKAQRKAYLGEDDDEDEQEAIVAAAAQDDQTRASLVTSQTGATTTLTTQTGATGAPVDPDKVDIWDIIKPTAMSDTGHFSEEVEINDYPQQARWKVTHKDALLPIIEFTDCAITTRGTFVPAGRTPAPGERKLYLYIEGPDRRSVLTAKADIKQMLKEAAATSFPERDQYSKYTI